MSSNDNMQEVHYIQLPRNQGKYKISDLDWKKSPFYFNNDTKLAQAKIYQWDTAAQDRINQAKIQEKTYDLATGAEDGEIIFKEKIGNGAWTSKTVLVNLPDLSGYVQLVSDDMSEDYEKIDSSLINFPEFPAFSEEIEDFIIFKILDDSNYNVDDYFAEEELEEKLEEGYKSIQFYGFFGDNVTYSLSYECDIQTLKNHLTSQSFICNLTCDILSSIDAGQNIICYDVASWDSNLWDEYQDEYRHWDEEDYPAWQREHAAWQIAHDDWEQQGGAPEDEPEEPIAPTEPEAPSLTKTTYNQILSDTFFFDIIKGLIIPKYCLDNPSWLEAKEGLAANTVQDEADLIDALVNDQSLDSIDNIFTAFNNANNQNNEHNYFELKARYIR